jgi:4-oxalocrotonate tautomerase
MPFANFKFPEGTVDHARKEEIIHRTTAMFVEYFGEKARPFSMVLVEEVADGGWGRADETLTMAKMGMLPKAK